MAFLREADEVVPDEPRGEPVWVTYAGGYRSEALVREARAQRAAWTARQLRRLFGGLAHPLQELISRRRRQADVQDLLELDERTLADIGLRREDLWSVVRGQVRFDELTARRSARTTTEVVHASHRRPFIPVDDLENAA